MKYLIEERLYEAGLTLKDLAARVGKSYSATYNSIKNTNNPPMPFLEKVSEVLGCRVCDLLDDGKTDIVDERFDCSLKASIKLDGKTYTANKLSELQTIVEEIKSEAVTTSIDPLILFGRLMAVVEHENCVPFTSNQVSDILAYPSDFLPKYSFGKESDDRKKLLELLDNKLPDELLPSAAGKVFVGYNLQKSRF